MAGAGDRTVCRKVERYIKVRRLYRLRFSRRDRLGLFVAPCDYCLPLTLVNWP